MYRIRTSLPTIRGKFHQGKEITQEWMLVNALTPELKRMQEWGEIIIEKEKVQEKEEDTGQTVAAKPGRKKTVD